jgi:hypothetical protein
LSFAGLSTLWVECMIENQPSTLILFCCEFDDGPGVLSELVKAISVSTIVIPKTGGESVMFYEELKIFVIGTRRVSRTL